MLTFRLLGVLLATILLFLGCCSFEAFRDGPVNLSAVDSEYTLTNWLLNNTKYIPDEDEYWKLPNETLKDKGGDCEDFAILTKKVMSELGVKGDIILLQSKLDKKIYGHAIFVFKKNGLYKIFDNQILLETKETKLTKLLDFYYSDWVWAAKCTETKFCYAFMRNRK